MPLGNLTGQNPRQPYMFFFNFWSTYITLVPFAFNKLNPNRTAIFAWFPVQAVMSLYANISNLLYYSSGHKKIKPIYSLMAKKKKSKTNKQKNQKQPKNNKNKQTKEKFLKFLKQSYWGFSHQACGKRQTLPQALLLEEEGWDSPHTNIYKKFVFKAETKKTRTNFHNTFRLIV